MQAVPALLTNNPDEFIAQYTSFVPHFKRFSIDVIDGAFANNRTLTIPQIQELITSKKIVIPPGVMFDFDLMVVDYESHLNDLLKLRQYVPIEHAVIYLSPLRRQPLPVLSNINIGLSTIPQDDISKLALYYDLKSIPVIQIMTINPGFQGSPFIEKELEKIEQLRASGYRNKIFLDGGVNDRTIPLIRSQKFQPDFLCIGSFLTKAPDLTERVQYLHAALG